MWFPIGQGGTFCVPMIIFLSKLWFKREEVVRFSQLDPETLTFSVQCHLNENNWQMYI